MESVAAYENYAVGIYGVTPLNIIFPSTQNFTKMKKYIEWHKHVTTIDQKYNLVPLNIKDEF